jgi:DNA polymerase-3 subunit delta'
LLNRLGGALASSRFPQAALLVGPPGVGKQRLALWVAQGLLCDEGPGAPCGTCAACHQVEQLGHPDLHWFVPIPRPKASDPAKLIEEAAEILGEVMADRRKDGLWQRPEGLVSHSLASVRLLHRKVWVTPFAGDRKVFIVGDAERLVVQESSQEAANALLKVLEEPPTDTTVILTAADPQALLPTIRSRLVSIRVQRVADDDVRQFLRNETEGGHDEAALERRTLLAEGCIGQAVQDLDEEEDQDRTATEFLAAVRDRPEAWLRLALAQPPYAARGEFTEMLDAVAVHLRRELRDSAGRDEEGTLKRMRALQRVEATREAAQGNANPQLALAVLAEELGALL